MPSPPRPYSSNLSDHEWEILVPLIPIAKPGGRPRKWPMRTILDAIFYVLKTGCQWRMLPREFPPWSTVHHYFRMWRLDGTWGRINTALRERLRTRAGHDRQPSAGILDTQSVKTTSVGGVRGYDGAKKLSGRKRHLLVDTLAPARRGSRSIWDGASRWLNIHPRRGASGNHAGISTTFLPCGLSGSGFHPNRRGSAALYRGDG